MPTDVNGVAVPTIDDLRGAFDLLEKFFTFDGTPLVNLWEYLFGSGHAGSCGAFREQYYDTISVLTPPLDDARRAWGQSGVPGAVDPTSIIAAFQSTLDVVTGRMDDQFNEFRGANLVGQTMFASRMHIFLFRKWVEAEMFGTAQYAQIRTGTLFDLMNNATQRLFAAEQAIIDLQGSAGQGGGTAQQIAALQASVAQLYDALAVINNEVIPGLYGADANFANAINTVLIPQLQDLQGRITILQNTALTTSSSAWNNLLQRVSTTESTISVTILPRLANVESGLAGVQLDISGRINPALLDLANRLTTQGNQITLTLLPGLTDTTNRLNALYDFQNSWVIPWVNIHGQQIADIQSDIQGRINPQLQKALRQIAQVRQQNLPNIRQRIKVIEQQIPQVLEIPDILTQITQLRDGQTQLERQKAEDIVPHLNALDDAVLELANDLQNRQNPQDAIQDAQIANIQNWIINVGGPSIAIHTDQITNIQNTITNVIAPNLSLFLAFINNITVTILTILQVNCQQVLNCLIDTRKQNPDTTCEEGRQFWGRWAECWLDANTPESLADVTFQSDDLNPDEIVAWIAGAFDEEEESRAFQIIADTVVYLGRAQDENTQGPGSLFSFPDDNVYIFETP